MSLVKDVVRGLSGRLVSMRSARLT